jgi:tetratricopeptide (TPR) repeat protein
VQLNYEALRIYRLVEDGPGISIRFFNLGHVYKNIAELRDLKKAARYYRKAYNSYPERDRLGRAQCLGQLGAVSLALVEEGTEAHAEQTSLWRNLKAAIGYYLSALEMMPQDAIIDIGRAHNQLGAAYRYLTSERKKALTHFKAAARYFEAAGESFENAGARMNAAQLLRSESRLDEAYAYTIEAIQILRQSNYRGPYLTLATKLLAGLRKELRTRR